MDLVLPDGRLIGAVPLKGVVIRNESDLDDEFAYYRVKVEIDNPYVYAVVETGKGYDWSGLFGFIARKAFGKNNDRWFCSEYIAWVIERAGVRLVSKEGWRITPQDLVESPLLERVS